jgi:Protein of unknown function (DUF3168)
VKTLDKAIYTLLSGDATLTSLAPGGVWRGVAPVSVTGTFVSFTKLDSQDDYTLGMRATSLATYQVKAITPGESAVPAMDAAARIDALLTDATLSLDAGRVLSVRRSQTNELDENDGGERYQHAISQYRITTQD